MSVEGRLDLSVQLESIAQMLLLCHLIVQLGHTILPLGELHCQIVCHVHLVSIVKILDSYIRLDRVIQVFIVLLDQALHVRLLPALEGYVHQVSTVLVELYILSHVLKVLINLVLATTPVFHVLFVSSVLLILPFPYLAQWVATVLCRQQHRFPDVRLEHLAIQLSLHLLQSVVCALVDIFVLLWVCLLPMASALNVDIVGLVLWMLMGQRILSSVDWEESALLEDTALLVPRYIYLFDCSLLLLVHLSSPFRLFRLFLHSSLPPFLS